MSEDRIPEGTLVRALNVLRVCYAGAKPDDIVNAGTYGTVVYYPDYSKVTDELWYGVRWYREAGMTGIEAATHEIELVDLEENVTHASARI